jgi:hypothetical protein
MPTRFKLDENLPRDAAVLLQQAGHDVHTVLAEQLGGHPDQRVFDASQAEERVLITFDLDFSDLRVYPLANHHHGIWVLVSGYCARTPKVSRAHWHCCDPRCEFLKMSLHKGGCGSSSLNVFAFMNKR